MCPDSLILLHAIFRHGERTPDKSCMYPNDPHMNEEFQPYGSGNLTNVGKMTMYDLGDTLRNMYNDFLGDQYMPGYVDAFSTDSERAKCSLQLILASLYPPKHQNVWHEKLKWQPIAYSCLPMKYDKILGAAICNEEYLMAYRKNFDETDGKLLFEEHRELLNYLRHHTGSDLKYIRDLWLLLGTLSTEQQNGLKLPGWTQTILTPTFYSLVMNEYWMQTATKELRRHVHGKLMQKILRDTLATINKDSKCKIHLYSGHDFNVAHVLIFFEVMFPHFPSYASCIVIEVHKVDTNDYRLQLKYRPKKTDDFQNLTFQNGNDYLRLEEFRRMVDDLFDDSEFEVEVSSQSKL